MQKVHVKPKEVKKSSKKEIAFEQIGGQDDSEEELQIRVEKLSNPTLNEVESEEENEEEIENASVNIPTLDFLPSSWSPIRTNKIEEFVVHDAERQETYEDLCRAHFERYVREADLYMQQWDPTSKLISWKSRLQPLLDVQESRPVFSVKTLTTEIMEVFPIKSNRKSEGIGETVALEKMVEGKEVWEICRSFVAALHMVNAGNIGIKANRDMNNGNDDVTFTLLSRKQIHDIENYVPPSQKLSSTLEVEENEGILIKEKGNKKVTKSKSGETRVTKKQKVVGNNEGASQEKVSKVQTIAKENIKRRNKK